MCANGCAFSMAPISAWKSRVARARAPSFELMFPNLSQLCRRLCGDKRNVCWFVSLSGKSSVPAGKAVLQGCSWPRSAKGGPARKRHLTSTRCYCMFCKDRNNCNNELIGGCSHGGKYGRGKKRAHSGAGKIHSALGRDGHQMGHQSHRGA